ncbi:MAG: fumarylacetoacetate hydrolase family protein [Xanthomonadales bacterium]|nr:fumarylacetoacetate hydrolase family protein [Xanthomonadales bacterium]
MKLLRYGKSGSELPGVLDPSGKIRDLTNEMSRTGASDFGCDTIASLRNIEIDSLPVVTGSPRIGPCVAHCGKFICIGLNYIDHAIESGMEAPKEPVLFMKATSAIVGANDDIVIPRGGSKVDWEVELGVVIGKHGAYLTEEEANDHIAGYCVINDLSERAFQLEGTGQWVKGKSCDSFGPMGPWLVTPDEIKDSQNLGIWLNVNGKTFQNSTTRNMIFGVKALVSYVSRYMSLQPGDVISTGTPPGVGLGKKPPVYLQEGDEVELGIDGLGVQKQRVVAPR